MAQYKLSNRKEQKRKKKSRQSIAASDNTLRGRNKHICLLNNDHIVEVSEIIKGLSYCRKCRIFYLDPTRDKNSLTLTEVCAELKRISGDPNVLFEPRCASVIANICGEDTFGGRLKILHLLSENNSTTQYQRECIINESWNIVESALQKFAYNHSLDIQSTLFVYKAIRTALNKEVEDRLIDQHVSFDNTQIVLKVDSNEVETGEPVLVSWQVKVKSDCICHLTVNDNPPSKVPFFGSKKFEIKEDTIFSITVYFKGTKIDNRNITVSIKRAPQLISFYSTESFPVMEGSEVRLYWQSHNATTYKLIRKTNDYNTISIDVTNSGGKFSFKARKSEVFELIAGNKHGSDKKTLIVDVIPIPKFIIGQIPDLSSLYTVSKINMLEIFNQSQFEHLSTKLNHVVLPYQSHDLYPPLLKSIKSALALCEKFFSNIAHITKRNGQL